MRYFSSLIIQVLGETHSHPVVAHETGVGPRGVSEWKLGAGSSKQSNNGDSWDDHSYLMILGAKTELSHRL